MNATGNRGKQVFNEINITPLTDIFLVLLIIMMVVAPMVESGRADIKPPTITSGSAVDPDKVTVEVSADGHLYVQGKAVEPGESLASVLKVKQAELEARNTAQTVNASSPSGSETEKDTDLSSKNLIIRADQKAKSGEVIKVFSAARDAGFAKVTVAGEPLSQSRQTSLETQNTESGGS
jgi:biopolymer transport protein ExbD